MNRFWDQFFKRTFMCHRMPSRSFFYKGKQFPICARCTGLLIGYIVFIPMAFFILPKWYMLLLLVPMIIDGGIQKRTCYESNNVLRLITGILGGIGIFYLIYLIGYSGFMHGRQFAKDQELFNMFFLR